LTDCGLQCVFQVYRGLLLPVANTWMLWSLFHKLDVRVTPHLVLAEAALLALCYLCAYCLRLRFMLVVPVQLVTVLLSATVAASTCGADGSPQRSVLCVAFVCALQLLLGLVLPLLVGHALDARRGRRFMPHVQAKRQQT